MTRQVRCWWCGQPYDLPADQAKVIQDTETSWICADDESEACARRAIEAWERGEKRNKGKPGTLRASHVDAFPDRGTAEAAP